MTAKNNRPNGLAVILAAKARSESPLVILLENLPELYEEARRLEECGAEGKEAAKDVGSLATNILGIAEKITGITTEEEMFASVRNNAVEPDILPIRGAGCVELLRQAADSLIRIRKDHPELREYADQAIRDARNAISAAVIITYREAKAIESLSMEEICELSGQKMPEQSGL